MPLKARLQLYLEQTGTTQSHVAKTTQMPFDTLNRFLKGHRSLPRRWVSILDGYLTACGY